MRFNWKKGGKTYTLVSIIIIIMMLFFAKNTTPQKNADYPEIVYYNNISYKYSDTVKKTSFNFVRKAGASYEGFLLLFHRENKNQNPPEAIYIYIGSSTYRKYNIVQ